MTRGRALFALALALALTGCGLLGEGAPHEPTGTPIILGPETPLVAPRKAAPGSASPTVVPDVTAYQPSTVVRDTNALSEQAYDYVQRRDSDPAVNRQLSALNQQLKASVSRMEASRTHAGYRPGDVIAARISADALAAFLATQSRADPGSAPGPPAPAPAPP